MNIIFKYFPCILLLWLPNLVNAEDWYFKIDAPLYTGLSKAKNTTGSQAYKELVSLNHKIKTNYRFALGYQISNYFDTEINFGSYNYSFVEVTKTNEEQTIPSSVFHNSFAFAFNDYGIPYCANIPSTFLTKSDICENTMSHNSFAFAFNDYGIPYCAKIPSTFLTKSDICGETQTITKVLGTQISSKLYTFLPLLRFKPLKNTGRFTPYVSAGIGVAYARAKIAKYFISQNNIRCQILKKRTNALALELGVGTNIKIAKKINLDIEAKYFNYGKHEFVAGNSTRIKGYRFTSALKFFL